MMKSQNHHADQRNRAQEFIRNESIYVTFWTRQNNLCERDQTVVASG